MRVTRVHRHRTRNPDNADSRERGAPCVRESPREAAGESLRAPAFGPAFCGVSAGGLGGARAVEQLKLVALGLKMTPISEAVYFSNVLSLFDQRGNIQDTNYIEKVEIMLKELIRHIQEKI